MTDARTSLDALQIAIVSQLRARGAGDPLSQPELLETLDISYARLREGLAELEKHGYKFRADRPGLIDLVTAPDRMIDTEILGGLNTSIFGREVHCYGRIRSTNSRAVELAEANASEGTIVVAEEQTGGRGRLGRSWHSPPQLGIWSSVILRPPGTLENASGLSLLAAVAFAETVEGTLPVNVQVKWPNDGLINGKKVLGILTEVSTDQGRVAFAVCGTGINVNHQVCDFPQALRDKATSLAIVAGHTIDRMAFYRTFLSQFDVHFQRFRTEGIAPFLPEYRKRSSLLGNDVVVSQGNERVVGTAVAINDIGALVVRSHGEDVVIFSGEATLRI